MSIEMKVALIGLVGALIGAIVTYIATTRATNKQLTAQRRQTERHRVEKEQEPIVQLMADFLTEYTAEEVKRNPDSLRKLDRQFQQLVKSLYIRGREELSNEVSIKGRDYLEALESYARGDMSWQEFNDRRIRAREGIKKALS